METKQIDNRILWNGGRMRNIRDISKIILASASPRRKELLEQMGLEFEVIPSEAKEVITRKIPWEIVVELSSQKARELMFKVAMDSISSEEGAVKDILVIGADTIVVNGETEILGKPANVEDAVNMLKKLQGHEHYVYTGVSMIYLKEGIAQTRTFVEKTKVMVAEMTEKQIKDYVATGEPMDKAGAYGIQGRFAEFIIGIEGDYNNVVGLPIGRLMRECNF